MFGFEFPDNFRYPYISRSITEFWRRWHITLSSWFREYVYIPLGGNRCTRGRMYLNLLAVWSLTGIWHGAGFNFLLWGLYFFVILAVEKAFLGRVLDRLPRILSHLYAVLFIAVGWFIFAADGIADVSAYLGQMVGIGCELSNTDATYELLRNLPFLAIMAVGATPLPHLLMERFVKAHPRAGSAARSALAFALLVLSTCYLADSGYNPFLYFRF